ncbi:MAG: enoyl-CoA hydratase, partial [Pseudomonadota bacterium]|nr:enoyl-CoA hydratase [Pseudomonadota bacterium]
MDEILLTEISAGIATVTLNRPKQMNALTAELRRRFGQALEALGADDSVAAVIITGA